MICCFNLTFDIINAIANIATFGTFVFLIYENIKTNKKVDKLTTIAEELKEQTEIEKKKIALLVRPDFSISRIHSAQNVLECQLVNKGKPAYSVQIIEQTGNINLSIIDTYFDTNKINILKITPKNNTNSVNIIEFKTLLNFEDELGNKYSLSIFGKNGNMRLLPC